LTVQQFSQSFIAVMALFLNKNEGKKKKTHRKKKNRSKKLPSLTFSPLAPLPILFFPYIPVILPITAKVLHLY